MTPRLLQAPTQPHVARERAIWMDVLRGIAIVLVVELHATALIGAHGIVPSSSLEAFSTLTQAFRMPMLMLLSGMLIPAALEQGAVGYLGARARGILWPLLVWSVLLAVFDPAHRWESLETMLTGPTSFLWFLHTLFVCSVIAFAVHRMPWWISASAAFLVAIVAGAVDGPEWLDTDALERTALLLAYLLVGALIASHLDRVAPILRRAPVFATLLIVGLGIVGMGWSGVHVVAYTEAETAPLVLASLLGAIGLALRLPAVAVARPFAALGRRSVVTYVMHWFVLDAVIPMSSRAVGPGIPALTELLAVLITLIVCGGVAALADRSRIIDALFRFPRFSRRPRPRGTDQVAPS